MLHFRPSMINMLSSIFHPGALKFSEITVRKFSSMRYLFYKCGQAIYGTTEDRTIGIPGVHVLTSLFILTLTSVAFTQTPRETIERCVGDQEYTRLMHLSLDDFDQSFEGFRKYSDNYELLCLLIPEYIQVQDLSIYEAANLHWHLGQIHAFEGNVAKAIGEMQQSNLETSPIFWKCYVEGSIAFLEHDKPKLMQSLALLREQENQMNIEFLEKFVRHFDKPYWEAYGAED